MIAPEFCRMMARYNRWQNSSLVAAADVLSEADRLAERGAFFGSIMGTFSHLLWADTLWMSRIDSWDVPAGDIPQSPTLVTKWDDYKIARQKADGRIIDWEEDVSDSDLGGTLVYRTTGGRTREKPMALLVPHFFNHQTHHRGQVHAMLTAAGASPEATDLLVMPENT